MSAKPISKSNIVLGFQCKKALWLEHHQPHLATPPSDEDKIRFAEGHKVGERAQKKFKNGALIPLGSWKKMVEDTQKAIKDGALTIFESAFMADGFACKADIITRKSINEPWDYIEVKSGTKAKSEYIQDLAIQSLIFEAAGFKANKYELWFINRETTAPELKKFFIKKDFTQECKDFKDNYFQLNDLKNAAIASACPEIKIGSQCSQPYDCKFKEHCWNQANIPEFSVFDLYKANGKQWQLFNAGIKSFDNPNFENYAKDENLEFDTIQQRVIDCSTHDQVFVDKQGLSKALKEYSWPMHFLDFETISYASPKFSGLHPYDQVPFQFVSMLQEKINGPIKTFEFLHTENTDPRPSIALALTKAIPKDGHSVIAIFSKFEHDRLMELADSVPEHKDHLIDIAQRLLDPQSLYRQFVYHRKLKGSFSLKALAPTFLGDQWSYENLEVGHGTAAQMAWLKIIDPQTSDVERQRLETALKHYCKLDVESSVRLVEKLFHF